MEEKTEIKILTADDEYFEGASLRLLYPYIEEEVFSRWYEDAYFVGFEILIEGKRVGLVAYEIYDFLHKGEGNVVILDGCAFILEPEFRGKGIAADVLRKIIPIVKNYYLETFGFKVVGIVLESNTAIAFHNKVIPTLGYPFEKLSWSIAGQEVAFYCLNIED